MTEQFTAGGSARITVRRDLPDDVQLRQIIVKLDRKRVGVLLYGDTVTLDVAPGRHWLQVDNTWNWKTISLELKPGEHKKFATKSRAGWLTTFLVGTLGAGPMYVSVQLED
jgi:hypothetical protein